VRIDRIDLIRFGHFAGREIELPPRKPDFYLFYGDNEAGKSTLLRGISALFFGVPTKTQDAHSFKTTELRIGATISQADTTFSFRRRKGVSGTLLSTDDAQMQESALAPFLKEVDRDRFEQFFALTHDRLREGGDELLRGNGDVGSALFQAAGLLELRKLLDGLDKEAREVFSPRSRGKIIGTALEEYKEAKSEARVKAISAAEVKEKRAALQAATDKLETLKSESQTLQQELVRLRRIATNKPDVARLQDLRSGLEVLQSVPAMPTAARRQRDEAANTLASATTQIRSLSDQIAHRKAQIAQLPIGSKFRAHAKQIEDLNAEISQYILSVKDRPKRIADRDQAIGLAEVEWKEIWRKRPIGDAEELRAAYSRKAEILELITEQALLSTALEQAEEYLDAEKEQQQRLAADLAAHPELQDPGTLIATIDQAKSLGDVEQIIAGLKTEIERLHSAATRDRQAWTLFDAKVEELVSMPVPLTSTIDVYARESETLATRQKEVQTLLARLANAIRSNQAEIQDLGKEIGSAGENDLARARENRDRLWQLIRASEIDHTLSPEEAKKRWGSSDALPEAFINTIVDADQIADLRFANSKEVAVRDRLVKQIQNSQLELQALELEQTNLKRQEKDLRLRWRKEWRTLGAEPLSPAEMKEWMQHRQTILNRLEQARQKEDELQMFQNRVDAMSSQISAHLEKFSYKVQTASLPVLITVAEKFARGVEDQLRSRAALQRQLNSLLLDSRQAKVNECKTKLAQWAQKWTPFIRALLLPELATTEHVKEALIVLEKVFTHLHDAEAFSYRIKRIGDNIEAFEKKASELIANIDPSLASLPPDQAGAELHSRYVETGNAETARKTLEAENAADELTLATCRSHAHGAQTVLTKLQEIAGCDDDRQLEVAITTAEQRAAKREDYERIANGLIERNAVPELKQIEEEAAGFEIDSLQSQIAFSENRLKQLQEELIETGTAYGKLNQEYERLEGSSESALQAQRAEDALARVRPAVNQYLRLRIASEALQRAIESYREKHEAPVLKRASEIFSSLTLQDYSGLTTDFGDEDRPVLVAARKSGEKIQIDGLSDGTRDQLYLALRLAFIEHHVETVAPCPVIFDDILINFDDARSLATLRVIESLAVRTQVLFFTHHRRLAELGIEAGAEVVEIGKTAKAAIA
jgi:uncharacterized protein YhaN